MPRNSKISKDQIDLLSKTYKLIVHFQEESHRAWMTPGYGSSISSLIKLLKKGHVVPIIKANKEFSKFLTGAREFLREILQDDFGIQKDVVNKWIDELLREIPAHETVIEKIRNVLETYKVALSNKETEKILKIKGKKSDITLGQIIHDVGELLNIYAEAIFRFKTLPEHLDLENYFCPDFTPSPDYQVITYKKKPLKHFTREQGKILKVLHEAHLSPNPEIRKSEVLKKAKVANNISKWTNSTRSRKQEFALLLKEGSDKRFVQLNLSCKHGFPKFPSKNNTQ